jgi:hypothetical protein
MHVIAVMRQSNVDSCSVAAAGVRGQGGEYISDPYCLKGSGRFARYSWHFVLPGVCGEWDFQRGSSTLTVK